MWSERSREDWIVCGDRNTAYYHISTTIKKARNAISSPKNEVREWIFYSDPFQDLVRAYYLDLFSPDIVNGKIRNLKGNFPVIHPNEW